ncbi:hypothetical protein PS685_03995 [Pseudomonas fluorescens]|uniref:Uncharacterized protein n=1 Tax=Pseudomonas fluorescens TaxID=294 RepID=A0A5E6Z751_PSEFL|nr:hypothetical protein PS685_03995 [Pseudomonas fluorescens]
MQDFSSQHAGVAPHILAHFIGHRRQQHQVDAGREMLARPTEHHHTHRVSFINPLEDIDDFGPERSIHRIDLFRSIDLYMGDIAVQLNLKSLVIGHNLNPLRGAVAGR